MKTNRFFAAALSVALCINFAACSDDDNNDINPDNASKRVVRIVEKHDGGRTTVYDFGYDEDGRVKSFYGDKGEWFSYDITYSGNQATARYGDEVEKWTLNDRNNIVSWTDTDWSINCEYENGYLTKHVEKYWGDDDAHNYVAEDNFVWKDGLMISKNGETLGITYSKIPNKGNLCLSSYADVIYDIDNEELVMAGIFGNCFKMLPEKFVDEGLTWEYELDDKGYVKSAKEKCDDGYEITYEVFWEEIK